MKKVFTIAAIIGLVAVPTFVSAQHGADDANQSVASIRREDKPKQTTTTAPVSDDSSSTQSTVTVPGQTDPIKLEIEGDVSGATLSMEQAIAQAQAVFSGKTIVKVEVENEHGVLVYSIRFSDGSRMDIDAKTGAVVRTRNFTNHDNRDNEHRQTSSSHSEQEHEQEQENEQERHSSGSGGTSDSGRNHPEDD